jgi:hypothetical protein
MDEEDEDSFIPNTCRSVKEVDEASQNSSASSPSFTASDFPSFMASMPQGMDFPKLKFGQKHIQKIH